MDATAVSTFSTRLAMDGSANPPPALSAPFAARATAPAPDWAGGRDGGESADGVGMTTVGKGNAGGSSGMGVRVGVGGTGVAVGAGAGEEHAAITSANANAAAAMISDCVRAAERAAGIAVRALRRRFGYVHRFESDTRKPHPH